MLVGESLRVALALNLPEASGAVSRSLPNCTYNVPAGTLYMPSCMLPLYV